MSTNTLASVDVVSVSGVPCTGKTTLARAIGELLDAVVFSRDPLMKVLATDKIPLQSKPKKGIKGVGMLGYELQGALLNEQLGMRRSVVRECVAPPETRARWNDIAEAHGARFVDTVCSDEELHRRRFEARGPVRLRDWELTWDTIAQSRAAFVVHPEAAFVADAVKPVEMNAGAVAQMIRPKNP
jgi:predicted kinase